jgi:hypothetical protein
MGTNIQHTAIPFGTLYEQISASQICETELLGFAAGAFHRDYQSVGRSTFGPAW